GDRRSTAASGETARLANGQSALELDRLRRTTRLGKSINQHAARLAPELVVRKIHRGEAEAERVEPRMVVARYERDIVRAAELILAQRPHEADGHQVVGDEHRVGLLLE